MKKSLVLAMAMAVGVTASVYAANPFSDVPSGHWAYDSIAKLVNAGVIDGYGDTTFGGEKLMTRYEMAQIVAKAMAKGANVDKLAAEFADELDGLGVRVSKLEKKVDNVKITGNIRYSYKNHGKDEKGHGKAYNRFRSRLFVGGAINDNWKYTGMLENNRFLDTNASGADDVKLKRAYVDGRLGGLKVRGGRMYFVYSSQYDDAMDGVQVSYKFDKINVTGLVGKNLNASTPAYALSVDDKGKSAGDDGERLYMAMADTKIGVVGANVSYWKLDCNEPTDIYGVKLDVPVVKGLKLSGEYFNGDTEYVDGDKDGYEFRLSYLGAKAAVPGSWGLSAGYQDRPYATYINPSCLATYANCPQGMKNGSGDGFKGWDFGLSYTFAKNIVGDVKYFAYKAREKYHGTVDTLWADVIFTF